MIVHLIHAAVGSENLGIGGRIISLRNRLGVWTGFIPLAEDRALENVLIILQVP